MYSLKFYLIAFLIHTLCYGEKFHFSISSDILPEISNNHWKHPNANGFEPHQDAQVWEYLYPKIKSFISLAISVDKTNI